MAMFYAYVIEPPYTNYRYTISFASRDDADLWWRTVSDTIATFDAGSDKARKGATVKRISPQLYNHRPSEGGYNLMTSIEKGNDLKAENLNDRVFFTLAPQRDIPSLNPIPPIQIRDRISGQRLVLNQRHHDVNASFLQYFDTFITVSSYYIRSQRDSSRFWWVNNDGAVCASNTKATKFYIKINDNETRQRIMVKSDYIVITLAQKTSCCKDGQYGVDTAKDKTLELGQEASAYKFSDFQGGFGLYGSINRDSTESTDFLIQKTDDGENWELV